MQITRILRNTDPFELWSPSLVTSSRGTAKNPAFILREGTAISHRLLRAGDVPPIIVDTSIGSRNRGCVNGRSIECSPGVVYFTTIADGGSEKSTSSQRAGGQDNIENLQPPCARCNRVKGDRPQEYLVARLRELGIAA